MKIITLKTLINSRNSTNINILYYYIAKYLVHDRESVKPITRICADTCFSLYLCFPSSFSFSLLSHKRNVLISETCLGTSGFKPITCLLKIIILINFRNSTNNKIHITLRNSLFTIASGLNPSLESALTLVSRVSVFPLLLLLLLLLSHKRNVLISETCLGTSGFKPITCPEAKNAGQSGALTKIMILLVIVLARNARGLKCPARYTIDRKYLCRFVGGSSP